MFRFLLIPRTLNGSWEVLMRPMIFWYSSKTDPEANELLCQCKVGNFDLIAPVRFGQG